MLHKGEHGIAIWRKYIHISGQSEPRRRRAPTHTTSWDGSLIKLSIEGWSAGFSSKARTGAILYLVTKCRWLLCQMGQVANWVPICNKGLLLYTGDLQKVEVSAQQGLLAASMFFGSQSGQEKAAWKRWVMQPWDIAPSAVEWFHPVQPTENELSRQQYQCRYPVPYHYVGSRTCSFRSWLHGARLESVMRVVVFFRYSTIKSFSPIRCLQSRLCNLSMRKASIHVYPLRQRWGCRRRASPPASCRPQIRVRCRRWWWLGGTRITPPSHLVVRKQAGEYHSCWGGHKIFVLSNFSLFSGNNNGSELFSRHPFCGVRVRCLWDCMITLLLSGGRIWWNCIHIG